MIKTIKSGSTIAALLLVSGLAIGATALDGTIELDDGSVGYVDSDGNAVKTGLGECLRWSDWAEDTQNNACEGIEEVEEVVAEVEPEPEPAAAPAPEPAAPEPIVTTATLGGEALFDTDSDALNSASEQALADLLTQLDRFQEISAIDVTGHTDSRGAEDYNQGLSERRASAVQAFLQAAYPDVAISAAGMGESSPVATNSTPEGRQLNRRVEVQVTAKSITEPQS